MRNTWVIFSFSAFSTGRECERVYQLPYRLTIAIIAPSFLTAAVFNILGLTIRRVGTQYSRLPPRWCTSVPFPATLTHLISHPYVDLIVFMSLDLVSLVIQVIGGGKASIAAHDGNDPEPGGKIMMYGVTVQMVGITMVYPLASNEFSFVNSHHSQFCILGADFLFRFYWNKPLCSAFHSPQINTGATYPAFTSSEKTFRTFPTKVRLMLLGVGIATVWVFIRSIYRTIKLANGWTGQIMTNQAYFNVLDGAPILLAMFTLNIFHPGWLLREENRADSLKTDMVDGSYSITGTSEIGSEEYVLDIVRPKDTYILPLTLDLGWTLNVDDLWKLVAPIEHQHPPTGPQREISLTTILKQ